VRLRVAIRGTQRQSEALRDYQGGTEWQSEALKAHRPPSCPHRSNSRLGRPAYEPCEPTECPRSACMHGNQSQSVSTRGASVEAPACRASNEASYGNWWHSSEALKKSTHLLTYRPSTVFASPSFATMNGLQPCRQARSAARTKSGARAWMSSRSSGGAGVPTELTSTKRSTRSGYLRGR